MHAGEPTQNRPIAHLDMPTEGRCIGENYIIAHRTVVCHMGIGHKQAARTNGGEAAILHRATMHRAAFAEHIVVPDDDFRRLVRILFVLRRETNRAKRKESIASADVRVTVDHYMRNQLAARAENDAFPNRTERAHFNIRREFRCWMNDRHCVNVRHQPACNAAIRVASTASCPSTVARHANLPMLRTIRLVVTSRIN